MCGTGLTALVKSRGATTKGSPVYIICLSGVWGPSENSFPEVTIRCKKPLTMEIPSTIPRCCGGSGATPHVFSCGGRSQLSWKKDRLSLSCLMLERKLPARSDIFALLLLGTSWFSTTGDEPNSLRKCAFGAINRKYHH